MARASTAIQFGELGVEIKSTRKTRTVAILLTVTGELKYVKKLTNGLRVKLGEGIQVKCPMKHCAA